MTRALLLAAAAVAATIATAGSAFAQASTIRIEPRPYYGATITLEQGVRVWRSLPPTKYVIINPNNRTPLNLNLAEYNENRASENRSYDNTGAAAPGTADDGSYYGGRYVGGRFNRRDHRRHHHGHRGRGHR